MDGITKNTDECTKTKVERFYCLLDNTVPKFILDGFSESGFIVDDDGQHLKSLTLRTGYDKNNPRTEIEVIIHNG